MESKCCETEGVSTSELSTYFLQVLWKDVPLSSTATALVVDWASACSAGIQHGHVLTAHLLHFAFNSLLMPGKASKHGLVSLDWLSAGHAAIWGVNQQVENPSLFFCLWICLSNKSNVFRGKKSHIHHSMQNCLYPEFPCKGGQHVAFFFSPPGIKSNIFVSWTFIYHQ